MSNSDGVSLSTPPELAEKVARECEGESTDDPREIAKAAIRADRDMIAKVVEGNTGPTGGWLIGPDQFLALLREGKGEAVTSDEQRLLLHAADILEREDLLSEAKAIRKWLTPVTLGVMKIHAKE